MQAARPLRKVCLIAALAPLTAHGGELKISQRIVHGGVAIDAHTFVTGGIHYRLHGLPASEPGSPEEARARSELDPSG